MFYLLLKKKIKNNNYDTAAHQSGGSFSYNLYCEKLWFIS